MARKFLQHPVAHIGSIDRKKIKKKKKIETRRDSLSLLAPRRTNLFLQALESMQTTIYWRSRILRARLFVIFLFECKTMNQIQKEEKNENRESKIKKKKERKKENERVRIHEQEWTLNVSKNVTRKD